MSVLDHHVAEGYRDTRFLAIVKISIPLNLQKP